MKNLNFDAGFKITKCGEVNNDKLKEFKLSLNEFFLKKDYSQYNSFIVKGFEIKDQFMNPNLLLIEYEEILLKLIDNE